jgi:misacylated tRNA(Ala) deacylase
MSAADPSRALYLEDSYRRSCSAAVEEVTPDGIRLDRTVFYPGGGGQPPDQGELITSNGGRWPVRSAEKSPRGILHCTEAGANAPALGQTVEARIDWPIRYAHMRYHTVLHVLSGVVHHRFGSGITGGQIYAERARMDFSLPEFSRALAEELLGEVNAVAAQDLPVRVKFVDREAIAHDPSLVRVSTELVPDVDRVRLIEIGDFDVQADGGTHVASTGELGPAVLERIENKGARNKRLYLQLPRPPIDPTPSPS